MKKIVLIAVLMAPMMASAGRTTVESWDCEQRFNSDAGVIVVATVFEGQEAGEIKVSGTTHLALYEVAGFNRRWNFGGNDKHGISNYAFVLEPGGAAYYYQFENIEPGVTVSPSMVLTCTKTPKKK